MYKPKKKSFKHRCHVRIWSKQRHILRKWSETTYLRDKQCKKNLQALLQEIAYWNLSDAWRRKRITTTATRTAILLNFTNTSWLQELKVWSLKLHQVQVKNIFSMCQFKFLLLRMKVSLTRSWTSTAQKIFSGLRNKFSITKKALVFITLNH